MSPNKEVCVLEISVQLRQLHPLGYLRPFDFPSLLK